MTDHILGCRLLDWEMRLNDYLIASRSLRHAYGRHDCMLHTAACIDAVTGIDHGAEHRGRYRSVASAARHLKGLGFDSPEAMLDGMFETVPIGFAQRGDLVLTPPNRAGGWWLPGVCVGGVALCVTDRGLVSEPRSRWLKAWKVGR